MYSDWAPVYMQTPSHCVQQEEMVYKNLGLIQGQAESLAVAIWIFGSSKVMPGGV